MKEISIKEAQQYTSPNPFALVAARKEDGTTNLMALSWWCYAANNPAMLVVCIGKKAYTGELIQKQKAFCLCLPDESLKEAAFLCGTCSGRTVDKAEKFGIILKEAKTLPISIPKSSAVVFECVLKEMTEAGDHIIYLAEVAKCYANPGQKPLFAMEGYKYLDIATNI